LLSKWNPLDLPENIAKSEYIGFVPIIMKNMDTEEQLLYCIEDILRNKMGLDYNSNNDVQKNELKKLCRKLIAIR